MTALYIIGGIIAFFILVFSIRLTVSGEYTDDFTLVLSWLFIKIKLFPREKSDKPKKEKTKKEKPKEESPEDKTETEKKENIFVTFYKNKGFDGVVELINNAAYSLTRMLNSFRKHIVLRELFLDMTVSKGDAAETAVEYGRICQKVFPALSYICSVLPVKKYNANVEPDYLGNKNAAAFAFKISVRPIFFTNAVVVLAFRLIFKVGIKFLFGIKNKNKKSDKGGVVDER